MTRCDGDSLMAQVMFIAIIHNQKVNFREEFLDVIREVSSGDHLLDGLLVPRLDSHNLKDRNTSHN